MPLKPAVGAAGGQGPQARASDGGRTLRGIEAKNYDLKAVNPNAKGDEDKRTPAELLDIIEAKGNEIAEVIRALRTSL